MNLDEQKEIKKEILKIMNQAEAEVKESKEYQKLVKVLAKIPYQKSTTGVLEQLGKYVSADKREEFKAKRKRIIEQQVVTMNEVVESCNYFQKISDKESIQKLLFDLLTEYILNQRDDVVQRKNDVVLAHLDRDLTKGCINFQYGKTSFELKKHIFTRILYILRKEENEFVINPVTNRINSEYAHEKGYREIAIDAYFADDENVFIHDHGEDNENFFPVFLNFLENNQNLHQLLQREDLSENEKKLHIFVALEQSNFPKKVNLRYYQNNIYALDDDTEENKRKTEKGIVYLIAKEIDIASAVEFDNVLRGTSKATIEMMRMLYTKAQSTIVKESVRELVDVSLNKEERVRFYKESIDQELSVEEKKQLNFLTTKESEIHEFENLYSSLNSSELKKHLSYLGTLIFGEEKWKKFETIQLFKQELVDQSAKKSIILSEMMKKEMNEIEDQRMLNAIHFVDSSIQDLDKLKPEQIADILFKIKTRYFYWEEALQEQIKNKLIKSLSSNEKNEVKEMFEKNEVIHYISAWEKGKELPLISEETTNIINEVKLALDNQHVDYLFPYVVDIIGESTLSKLRKLSDGEQVNFIESTLKGNRVKYTYSDICRWKEKILVYDKKAIKKEFANVTHKIEKFLKKKLKQTNDKTISKFLVELNSRKDQIKTALNEAYIFVHTHRRTEYSEEQQFRDVLYQNKVIQKFISEYPYLKNIIEECIKQVPLVSYRIDRFGNMKLKNARKMTKPFAED